VIENRRDHVKRQSLERGYGQKRPGCQRKKKAYRYLRRLGNKTVSARNDANISVEGERPVNSARVVGRGIMMC